VVDGTGGTDDRLGQVGQIGRPADFIELAGSLEIFGRGDEVEGGVFAIQLDKDRVDDGVGRVVKILRGQEFGQIMEYAVVKKNAAEHGLFGLEVVRRDLAQQIRGHLFKIGKGGVAPIFGADAAFCMKREVRFTVQQRHPAGPQPVLPAERPLHRCHAGRH